MKLLSALILIISLFSCTTGVTLRPVRYSALFNDYNSKVWIINKMIIDGVVVSPSETYDKHIMVFHYNQQHLDYIALRDITRKPPRKGYYFVDSDKKKLTIEFNDNDENWIFDLVYLTEDSILMQSTTKSDFDATIQLKPFPEL